MPGSCRSRCSRCNPSALLRPARFPCCSSVTCAGHVVPLGAGLRFAGAARDLGCVAGRCLRHPGQAAGLGFNPSLRLSCCRLPSQASRDVLRGWQEACGVQGGGGRAAAKLAMGAWCTDPMSSVGFWGQTALTGIPAPPGTRFETGQLLLPFPCLV